MSQMYILIDRKPIIENDIIKWGRWFESLNNRLVNQCLINENTDKEVRISTIFLGLDHSFGYHERPILFETMIFGGEHDQYTERYSTWNEAKIGHQKAIDMIFEASINN